MLGYTKTAVTIESFHIRRLIFRYQQAYLKNMPVFAYRGQWILKNNERSVRTNLAKVIEGEIASSTTVCSN